MATRSVTRMKATIWTPTMKTDVDGTPDGVIPLAFYALSTAERRAECIKTLQAIDAKLTAQQAVAA